MQALTPTQTSTDDFKPEQECSTSKHKMVVHLPPSTIKFKIKKGCFSIILETPRNMIYQIILVYHDSNGEINQFYQFEMMHLLRDNVKIDIDGSIIRFSFETYHPIEDVSNHFSYSFSFSNACRSKFEFGNQLESMPILLPLNEIIHHIWSNFFYYLIPRPNNGDDKNDCYEIYVVQSSDSSADKMGKRRFKRGDIVTQKIIWDSGRPSIRKDPATGHFFVASESDDPKKPISIEELTESNHLIHLPVPNGIELLQNRTLVLSDLSIKFDSESILTRMIHLSNDLYLFQRSFHPTIQEICIVRSSPPDYWRPQLTKYFSNGDVIVKKIYMKTPNPLDVLECSDCILLVTSGNDELYGYRLFLYTLEDLK